MNPHETAINAAIAWGWFSRRVPFNVRGESGDPSGVMTFVANVDDKPHRFEAVAGVVISEPTALNR